MSVRTIAKACGVGTTSTSRWRAGRTVPHPRHWTALAALAGVDVLKRAPVTPDDQTGAKEAGTMPATTTTEPSPADLPQRAAITRARERRRVELLPLRTKVAEAIKAVGWRRACPVVGSVLGTVPVTGPHGAWWGKVGKRAGAAILAGLVALPAQQRQGALPLEQAQ